MSSIALKAPRHPRKKKGTNKHKHARAHTHTAHLERRGNEGVVGIHFDGVADHNLCQEHRLEAGPVVVGVVVAVARVGRKV